MKKKRVVSLTASIAGLLLMFMAFSSISLAEPPPQFQPMRPHFPIVPLLPDLSIDDIRLTPDCRVIVRVRNNGPGNLPDNVWTDHKPNSAGVYLTINGNKWGGGTIWLFDPARSLKAPGGTAEYVSNLKVTSPSQVKAEVDTWNVVAEKNESNNWMTRNLACAVPGPGPIGPGPIGPGPGPIGPGPIFPLLPDLSIDDIRLTPDCRVIVRVRNNGPGNLPDNVWTDHKPNSAGVYLTINGSKWGGGTIWLFDPARSLKAPGGTAEYVSNLKVTSPSQVKAEVDTWNVVAEKNESNNWMTRNLACAVPGPGPIFPLLPDLSIDDIRLTPDCRVVVRVRNNGPGNLPDNVWTDHKPNSAGVYLTINGNKWGGGTIWLFDPARSLKAPGGTAEFVSTLKVNSPSEIKAEVDTWNVVAEKNESNNWATRNLACAGPGPGPGQGPGDLQVKIQGCPLQVRAGQDLGPSFQVWAKSSFNYPLNNVTVDLVLLSAPNYPVPAPYANYSPGYYNGVLLKGGRENESFPPHGIISVKLNGSNTIPANTPPGTYYLAAVVDAGNKVHETIEFNNAAYCKVKVLPPFFPIQPVHPFPPLQPVQPQQPPPQLPPIQPVHPVPPLQPVVIQEDCIPFNPANIEVKLIAGRWKIVEGSHWIFDFDNKKDEAYMAFNIIRHYGLNSTCYVGRPDPSFTYLLVNGTAPQGPFPGEDAIAFNPNTIEVKEFAGRWKIVDGSQWMFDFGSNKGEAVTAFNIIKKYGFRYSCFVGRPNASFIYMRK